MRNKAVYLVCVSTRGMCVYMYIYGGDESVIAVPTMVIFHGDFIRYWLTLCLDRLGGVGSPYPPYFVFLIEPDLLVCSVLIPLLSSGRVLFARLLGCGSVFVCRVA